MINFIADTVTSSYWRADEFFERLVGKNRLAVENDFRFCRVSSLTGFEDALAAMQSTNNFCCFSDVADGWLDLNNTPRTRRVLTVFFAMRHAVDDMLARAACLDVMREMFRQFVTVITYNRALLENNHVFIDPRISFNEIDRYFFSGCACAYFQIAVDKATPLIFNPNDWNL